MAIFHQPAWHSMGTNPNYICFLLDLNLKLPCATITGNRRGWIIISTLKLLN